MENTLPVLHTIHNIHSKKYYTYKEHFRVN